MQCDIHGFQNNGIEVIALAKTTKLLISCHCNTFFSGEHWDKNPLLVATVADLCCTNYPGRDLLEKILVVGLSMTPPSSLLSSSCHQYHHPEHPPFFHPYPQVKEQPKDKAGDEQPPAEADEKEGQAEDDEQHQHQSEVGGLAAKATSSVAANSNASRIAGMLQKLAPSPE